VAGSEGRSIMATTPNYGWVTPAPTDFVTDLPADFEIFADAVDADLGGLLGGTTGQYLAKDSDDDHDFSWVTPAANPITTEGDLIIGDATGDPIRLPIGAAGTVLTSDGDTAEWLTPSGPAGFTLLNAGGSALTGLGTVTVSGITSNDLLIYVTGAKSATTARSIVIQFNSSSTNHNAAGLRIIAGSTYAAGNFDTLSKNNGNNLDFSKTSTNADSLSRGFLMVQGCTSTSVKPLWYTAANDPQAGNAQQAHSGGGFYDEAAAITSVSLICEGANFNGGTLFVFGRS